MSLSDFALTKSWESPQDFPTYEENEEQVRKDMQCLFDELAVGINKLIGELGSEASGSSGASGIGVAEITGLEGYTNVQDALAGLLAAIINVQAGTVVDGSVTEPKLADDAVTTAKINDGAVTTPKLAAGAVTGEKTDFSGGLIIGGTLTQNGQIILDSNCYGTQFPATPTVGRLFFKKVGS